MRLDFKKLSEIAGVLAVVGSLEFVGLQIRQDRTIALVDAYVTGNESRKSDRRAQLESETFMLLQENLWSQDQRPRWWTDDLEISTIGSLDSGAQIMARILEEELDLLEMDSLYFRYENGLDPDGYWEAVRNSSLKNRPRDPFNRAVALNLGMRARNQITQLVSEIDRESGT